MLFCAASLASDVQMQQTPLHYAACNFDIETVRFLMQAGCNVLAVDDRGQTAVDAVKVSNPALCEL
jgi:ankyrin repeat protein